MSHICEIYTDDVLLYGATDDEYRDNTRKVLIRLRDGKVTANPEKTELGLDEVEYVGHLISKSTRSVYKPWTFPSLRLRKRLAICIRDHVIMVSEATCTWWRMDKSPPPTLADRRIVALRPIMVIPPDIHAGFSKDHNSEIHWTSANDDFVKHISNWGRKDIYRSHSCWTYTQSLQSSINLYSVLLNCSITKMMVCYDN